MYKIKFISSFIAILFSILVVYVSVIYKIDNLKMLNNNKDFNVITMEYQVKQLNCLATNIYWEAASESFEGKVAVAQVTLNRVDHKEFPKDICSVVYQKNKIYNKVICQFSWFCETNYRIKNVNEIRFEECYRVAKKVLLEGFRLEGLTEAIYYHADYVSPNWKKEKITKIGSHIFYKSST